MSFQPRNYDMYKFIPVDQLDTWGKLNTKDLCTVHMNDFNDYNQDAISWNNNYAGHTNTEIRVRHEPETQLFTFYLHRFGM